MNYKKKYLKYKLKYLTAKKLYGGMYDGSMNNDNVFENNENEEYEIENINTDVSKKDNEEEKGLTDDIKTNFEKKTTIPVKEALQNLKDIGIKGKQAEDIIWLNSGIYSNINSEKTWKKFLNDTDLQMKFGDLYS